MKAWLETTSMFCYRENLVGFKVIQQNEKSTQRDRQFSRNLRKRT